MKADHYKIFDGEQITIYQLDDGFYLCPVCGGGLGISPYCEDDVPGYAETYAWPSQDICYWCKTQFGNDNLPDRDHGETLKQKWEELRRAWFLKAQDKAAARECLRGINVEMPEDEAM